MNTYGTPGYPAHTLTGKKLAALRQLALPGAIEALPRTKHGNLATGIHAGILAHLMAMGLLEASHSYLRGVASPDLKVTAAGFTALHENTSK